MDEFETMFPDKSIYKGFVAPSSEGEILNVKQQLIDQLKLRGYSNIENTNGITISIANPNEKPNKIILEKNQKGGVSFFICPASRLL